LKLIIEHYCLKKIQFEEYRNKVCAVNAPKLPKEPTFYEKDIVQVLAKIKGQVNNIFTFLS